jgi:hypothetical protein
VGATSTGPNVTGSGGGGVNFAFGKGGGIGAARASSTDAVSAIDTGGVAIGAAAFALGAAGFATGVAAFVTIGSGFAIGVAVFATGVAGLVTTGPGFAAGVVAFATGVAAFVTIGSRFAIGAAVFAIGAACFTKGTAGCGFEAAGICAARGTGGGSAAFPGVTLGALGCVVGFALALAACAGRGAAPVSEPVFFALGASGRTAGWVAVTGRGAPELVSGIALCEAPEAIFSDSLIAVPTCGGTRLRCARSPFSSAAQQPTVARKRTLSVQH